MSKYRIDTTIVDTEKASANWGEETDWDGSNQISRPTGGQWEHERLYRSSKGRYYIVHYSQWEGSQPSASWVTEEEATAWLMLNDHAAPEDLEAASRVVSE